MQRFLYLESDKNFVTCFVHVQNRCWNCFYRRVRCLACTRAPPWSDSCWRSGKSVEVGSIHFYSKTKKNLRWKVVNQCGFWRRMRRHSSCLSLNGQLNVWSLKATCVPIKFADQCASNWKILTPMLSKTIGLKIHVFCLVLSLFEQACHKVHKQ